MIDTIKFWYNGAYFWLRSRSDTKLSTDGNHVPDIYLDIYCFTWNLSIGKLSPQLSNTLHEEHEASGPTKRSDLLFLHIHVHLMYVRPFCRKICKT